MTPLVSVICLCYNHERFVLGALQSVMDQTYSPIELIVVDDRSTDGSISVIEAFITRHPIIKFIKNQANQGNCQSFNQGLKIARGTYVIDLAADDLLNPSRVARGITVMESRTECGVQFSDAEIIDEDGKSLGLHSDRFPHATVPSGKIFSHILSHYFINSPTMMIRKSLLDDIGGYDETLAYEDFDFWVRSASRTEYVYIPEPLVKRRNLRNSMGKQQFRNNIQQKSTLRVCEKALALCTTQEEFDALRKRVRYEFRQSLMTGVWGLAMGYWKLLRKVP